MTEDVIESSHNGVVSWEKKSLVNPILIQGKDDNIKTMDRPVELYNAVHFLKKFTGIHIEGMQRVQSLDLMQKLCN